jgi:hypothetical protein
MSYVQPKWHAKGFTCPHCHIFTTVMWASPIAQQAGRGNTAVNELDIASCYSCNDFTLWLAKTMIYPRMLPVEAPNDDLDQSIKDDYKEAANIVNLSPRSAMALLRLCVQKLCKQLGKPGKNINDDIKTLVGEGLPIKLQQALDALRVTGNNAVHPGTMHLDDDIERALQLFKFLNLIAQHTITEPKEVEAAYRALPASTLDAIKTRDGAAPAPPTAPGPV